MDCLAAEPYISTLYDGEETPAEAVQHISDCSACKARLREYAASSSEVRVLAAAEAQSLSRLPLPGTLPSRGLSWSALCNPVRMPRFALLMGLAVIACLSVALGYVERQRKTAGLWFAYDLHLVQPEESGAMHPVNSSHLGMKFKISDGEAGPMPFFLHGEPGQLGVTVGIIEFQNVRSDRADLAIRVKHIDGESMESVMEKLRVRGPFQVDDVRAMLWAAPLRRYPYKPGTTLQIPVEGGGTLDFHGDIGDKTLLYPWQQFSSEPDPYEIVLDAPALVVGKSLILRPGGGVKIAGPNACAYIYIPEKGLLILAPRPFAGSQEAAVDRSYAMFELDHQWYYLFTRTPIAGGDRPGNIWVYLARNYEPLRLDPKWTPGNPFVGSAQDVGQVLAQVKQ